ncbi:hypothetical protein [Terasakiella sp. SH-1]|uniref:hypothetical protein n=1 Tax=Terasakiella sp. SH-1 TaxID=2560057 RepID=UPI0010740DE1|nr:hypothetical protein [Terasakiella sp. SH-1]
MKWLSKLFKRKQVDAVPPASTHPLYDPETQAELDFLFGDCQGKKEIDIRNLKLHLSEPHSTLIN